MSCRCSVNTLSLFIRNVTHVDVSIPRQATHQLRKPSSRNVTSRAITGPFLSSRAYSSATSSEDGTSEPRPKEPSQSPVVDFSLDAIDSILAESPLKLAAKEADLEREAEYETPLKSLLKDMPQKKSKDGDWAVKRNENSRTFTRKDAEMSGENGSRTTIRRTGGTGNNRPHDTFRQPSSSSAAGLPIEGRNF